MQPEGKDDQGYQWIRDLRYDDYWRLQDFEHLVVCKTYQEREEHPPICWEATIFDSEKAEKVIAREWFNTEQEAKEFLETYLELSLKNHKFKNSGERDDLSASGWS